MHAMKVRPMPDDDREVDLLIEVNFTNSYVLDGLHIGSISHYESAEFGLQESPKHQKRASVRNANRLSSSSVP